MLHRISLVLVAFVFALANVYADLAVRLSDKSGEPPTSETRLDKEDTHGETFARYLWDEEGSDDDGGQSVDLSRNLWDEEDKGGGDDAIDLSRYLWDEEDSDDGGLLVDLARNLWEEEEVSGDSTGRNLWDEEGVNSDPIGYSLGLVRNLLEEDADVGLSDRNLWDEEMSGTDHSLFLASHLWDKSKPETMEPDRLVNADAAGVQLARNFWEEEDVDVGSSDRNLWDEEMSDLDYSLLVASLLWDRSKPEAMEPDRLLNADVAGVQLARNFWEEEDVDGGSSDRNLWDEEMSGLDYSLFIASLLWDRSKPETMEPDRLVNADAAGVQLARNLWDEEMGGPDYTLSSWRWARETTV